MNELHVMNDSLDKKWGTQLMIGGQPHVIWLWMQDDTTEDADTDNDAYQFQLSRMIQKDGQWTNSSAVQMRDGSWVTQGVSQWRVDSQHGGSIFTLYDTFLAKVNAYILEQGEPPVDTGFPEDGTTTEQAIWLLQVGTIINSEGLVERAS